MRRSISLVLVAVMLLSGLLMAVPASAKAENIEYINALYFAQAPTIDGVVSTAEWGDEPSFEVWANDAETKDGGPYSRFLYWRTGAYDNYSGWYYTCWLRWDENYFYIAVKNYDPDVHSLKNGTTNTWDGDAVQTRIDKAGPNAVVQGDEFFVTGEITKPWSGNNIPDFLFGYVEIAGGFTEAWENTTNKGMTAFSNNPMGTAKAVVAPAGSNYSADTLANITTYEVAIPWAYIFNGEYSALKYEEYKPGRPPRGNPDGGIGQDFGMSMSVLDDGANEDAKWDAYLAWGSGICETHQTEGAATATGSNSVKLDAAQITPQAGYETKDPSSLLDAKFYTDHIDEPGKFYDYLAGDYTKSNLIEDESTLTTLKYDSEGDLSVWGAPEYQGKISNIGGDHGNVLDYRDAAISQTYIDTRDGELAFVVPPSYTFQFDICYTGNEVTVPEYASALYNWFGGASVIDYRCGYFFNDRAFEIVDNSDADSTSPTILARYDYDLKKDNWYTWRFQFDNESCTMRFWLDDLSTEADNAENEWGTMIFNHRWRYYYYSSTESLTNGTLLPFRQMNTQVMYDNVKAYNYASTKPVEDADEDTNGGSNGGGGSITTEVTGGDKVDVNDATKEDNKWYLPIKVKQEYLTANKLSFTVKFDPAKASFNSVDGLKEGAYTVTKVSDGEYTITINDFSAIKALKAGDTAFRVVLNALDESTDINQVVTEVKDAYTYTVTSGATGDATVFVVIALVVALFGCAVVVVARKRSLAE